MRLDFGGVGEGHYLSDFARTVMVGELNQKYVDIYTKMCETQEEIFSHIPRRRPRQRALPRLRRRHD